MEEHEKMEVVVKKGGVVDTKIKSERIKYVIEEVGYWRKANHIHNWFVENAQDGMDDCKQANVDREHLQDLLETCNRVIANPSEAEQLLPRAAGFFFGNTDYDEYYFESVRETISILEDCLLDEEAYFYYVSSW
jgi:hypothetical protein